MHIPYSKYSGAGNTFFLIDNREGVFSYSPALISSLCRKNPEREVDGMLLVENSSNADVRMRILNADGSEAEMCGNGLRVFIKFLEEIDFCKKFYRIETPAGIYEGEKMGEEICIKMCAPSPIQWNLPLNLPPFLSPCHFINTGVPHAVIFLSSQKQFEELDVFSFGASIRHHPFFSPRGTNVNFIFKETRNRIWLRTFERGVENETGACGTGAVASSLIYAAEEKTNNPIQVKVQSGEILTIAFKREFTTFSEISLQGPAKKISQGVFIFEQPEKCAF